MHRHEPSATERELRRLGSSASIFALLLGALMTGAPALAQAAEAGAPPPPAGGSLVGEVIVTAQKRSENVQKVPITINAVGAAQLAQHQVQTISDLTTLAPGLRTDDVAGMSNISIRGVGTTFTTGAGESSVAVHIDGVYIPQPKAALMGEDDLSQVEILRGPQGTLYGRNSTAGVINFVTAAPTKQPQGELAVRYGNYNDVRVQGTASGPISDDLSGRLFLTYEHHDGWGENIVTGQRLLDLTSYGGRATLDWRVKPWWDVELKVGGNYERFAGPVYQPFNANSLVLGLAPPNYTTLSPDDVKSFEHYGSDRQLETVVLKNNLKINDNISLTAITGYVHFQSLYRFDGFAAAIEPPFVGPGGPVSGPLPPITLEPYTASDAVSQEFDLKGDTHNLKWLVGLYYFHEFQRNNSVSVFDALGTDGLGLVPFKYYSNIARQDSSRDSISAFVDGTYSVTPKLRVFGGVRVLGESLSQNLTDIHSFGVSAPGDYPVTACSGRESLREMAMTGRGGVEYDITGQSMIYAQASTGFKSGGFSQDQCDNKYNPETVTSTEVGYKSQWFDNRLTFNISGYHYFYYNLELEEATIYGVPIVNVPRSHVWGADVSANLRVTDSLRFDASATFLDARYDEFRSGDATFGVPLGTNLAGIPLNKAPTASATIGANYLFRLPVGDLDLRAETYLTTSYHLREFNLPFTVQQGYAQLNLYATLKLDSDKYEVRAYGKNITNVRYITGIDGILTGAMGSYSPPPLYGVEVVGRF